MAKRKVLVAPLDWGLGHATRCIPIIKLLLEKNCEVIIGADKQPLALLKNEFPQLEYLVLPGYDVTYPSKSFMALQMLSLLPRIRRGIKQEHKLLNALIKEKNIDVVISDNRYGLYNKTIPSIFITHQLFIQAPIFSSLIKGINFSYINKFTECWVPDFEGLNNLSGDLSHKQTPPSNTCFIGPLTRMEKNVNTTEQYIDLLCILSGPEPQRNIFEKIVLSQLKNTSLKVIVIQGDPQNSERVKLSKNVELISHVNGDEMNKLILSSKLILCRSGYSSIMDLAILDKKVIFVPTPGQTEQEYLAEKFKKEKIAFSINQRQFNLEEAIAESKNYRGFDYSTKFTAGLHNLTNGLKTRIEMLLR